MILIETQLQENSQTLGTVLESDSQELEFNLGDVIPVSTNDHTKLLNRDKPSQHPTSSIINLDTELGSKATHRELAENELTNIEIDEMFRRMFS